MILRNKTRGHKSEWIMIAGSTHTHSQEYLFKLSVCSTCRKGQSSQGKKTRTHSGQAVKLRDWHLYWHVSTELDYVPCLPCKCNLVLQQEAEQNKRISRMLAPNLSPNNMSVRSQLLEWCKHDPFSCRNGPISPQRWPYPATSLIAYTENMLHSHFK